MSGMLCAPGGRQHERIHAKWLRGQGLQDGQRKGGRLAAARVRGAQHVAACQDGRDAAALHGRWGPHPQRAAHSAARMQCEGWFRRGQPLWEVGSCRGAMCCVRMSRAVVLILA